MPYSTKVEREYLVTVISIEDKPGRIVDQLLKIKTPSGRVMWGVTQLAVIQDHADPSLKIYRRKSDALEDILQSRGIE